VSRRIEELKLLPSKTQKNFEADLQSIATKKYISCIASNNEAIFELSRLENEYWSSVHPLVINFF